jgi:hypothetical protein
MADKFSFSYSFQTGPAGAQGEAADADDRELVAFAGCDMISLGSGSTLLLDGRSGRQMAVSPEVAAALARCNTFRPLGEHAGALVAAIPQLRGQLADVGRVLTSVRDAGLLLNAREVCDRLSASATIAPSLPPTRVFIITCDRPAAVTRLLDSMLQAGSLSRHEGLFLVDDSRDPDNARQNREAATRFNLGSAVPLHYVGAEAQRGLLAELAAALPGEAAAIRFLIDRERWAGHQSYGLARTVCLLLSVGRRCIVLDDDVLCRTVLPPLSRDGIGFGGGLSRELACYASEQELLQRARFGDTDPLSGHAACLGLPLAQAVARLGATSIGPGALRDTSAALLSSLRADSPLLVTQCGSWGDPGTTHTHWFQQLEPESVQRLLQSPGGLAGAMRNRHYWLGRSRPNIGKMAVMSQATGLDNSALLPPYFPVWRGEDYLFAAMVARLHPHAAVLDYPWCVPHLPLERRGGREPAAPLAARGGLTLCARYLVARAEPAAGVSPAMRLAGVAQQLRELGEYDSSELLALFRRELAQQQAEQLERLQRQLQLAPRFGCSEWESYLRSGVEEVSRALQAPASPTGIPGLPAGVSEEYLLRQGRTLLAEFGAALAAWPLIREAAAPIGDRLVRAGAPAP